MIFLGLDPGYSGGCAVIDGKHVDAFGWPETDADTAHTIAPFAGTDCFAYLESAHSMPKQGVSSSFKFGTHYGFLRAVLVCYKIPFVLIAPHKWQKEMGCLTRGDKNISKQKAQQLFPGIKITHATADALLIAEYARRKHGNSNAGEDLKQLHKQLKLKIDEHDLSGI